MVYFDAVLRLLLFFTWYSDPPYVPLIPGCTPVLKGSFRTYQYQCTVLGSMCNLRACLQGERVTLASGLPQHSHISSFFLCRVYKAARIIRLGRLPNLHARVTLVGGLMFSLVNTPGSVNLPTRVNFLIVSRPFECERLVQGCRVTLPVKFCL